MKVRNYLENIAGVGIYPVTTLLIFFIFFSILAIWVIRSGKQSFHAINNLPLDGTEPLSLENRSQE
jgi:hypothetical protein